MRRIFLAALFFLTGSLHAAWVEDTVIYEINSQDPKEVAGGLVVFQQLLTYLTADGLTAPSRLIVQKLVGHKTRYIWENDEECTIADPSTIRPVIMQFANAEFYYEKTQPREIWAVESTVFAPSPCGQSQEPLVRVLRKKKP